MKKSKDYTQINKQGIKFNHIPLLHPIPAITAETLPTGKRTYTTPSNKKYPSVTTMLGDEEKPYLIEWRESMGQENADKETKRAGNRGAETHSLIEYYLKNQLTPEIAQRHDPQNIFLFNQIRLSLNKINNIKVQETGLFSDTLRLAGSVDCVGEYNGVPSIIDFKTSTRNKTKAMIFDYFLQTTAYAIMYNELTNDCIEDITIIMAVEKGIVPLVFHEKIDKYVKPLLLRIKDYYRNHQ